jgi:cell wall integrity and stress response component
MLFTRDTALSFLALAIAAPRFVAALDPDVCATFNTGTSAKFTDNLQSNGLCHDHCYGDYAYSITKGYDCWCSNYAPTESDTVDLSECNFPCYGYPDEPCGGDNGQYSYVRLRNVAVAGTKGSSEPTTSSSKPKPTQQDDPEPTSEAPSSTSESVSEAESTTTESTTETSSEPASTAVRTVTADGTIKTVFVAPTGTANNGNNNSGSDSDTDRADGEIVNNDGGGGGGVSKGALAGIIVGVALGVIAIVGVGLWFFFRRRKNQQQQDDYQEDPSIRGSSSGMMGAGGQRQEMSMSGGSPGSPNTNSNRNSALLIDPRMDPFKQGLYVRSNSHESINTLRDDHDYSRKIQQRTLRATNPDPEIEG